MSKRGNPRLLDPWARYAQAATRRRHSLVCAIARRIHMGERIRAGDRIPDGWRGDGSRNMVEVDAWSLQEAKRLAKRVSEQLAAEAEAAERERAAGE